MKGQSRDGKVTRCRGTPGGGLWEPRSHNREDLLSCLCKRKGGGGGGSGGGGKRSPTLSIVKFSSPSNGQE